MSSHPDLDPSWLAFRYVLGELSAGEASAFERRLLDDQGAREAVAAAFELAGAVAIAGRDRPFELPRPRHRVRRVLAWSALASAAVVVIAAPGGFGRASGPEVDASRVASAWSSLRDRPGIEADGESDLIDREVAALPAPIEGEPTLDRPLPSWLVAGAAGPAEDSPGVED